MFVLYSHIFITITNNNSIHLIIFHVSDGERSSSNQLGMFVRGRVKRFVLVFTGDVLLPRHRQGDQPFDAPSNCVLLVLDRRAEGTSIMQPEPHYFHRAAAQIIARRERVINLNDGESSRARTPHQSKPTWRQSIHTLTKPCTMNVCALQHGSSWPRRENLMRDWRFQRFPAEKCCFVVGWSH